MREDICTIPVSEGFEQKDGCPICRMRDMAEKRGVDYIVGPAMMEPDIRIETNQKGFCHLHLCQLKKAKNRLSLALMLDSHLDLLEKELFASDKLFKPSAKKTAYKAARFEESCFICESLSNSVEQMIKTICLTYASDKDFRRLFNEQQFFCLHHLKLLLERANQYLDKSKAEDLCRDAKNITGEYIKQLNSDVRHFCDMFDYRNNTEDADWGNSKDSIERTIAFLSGRNAE